MRPFELSLPETLEEALKLADDEATFKAAGIDLLDRLKERVTSPARLVDLNRLRGLELGRVQSLENETRIGSLVPLQQVADAFEDDNRALAALRTACGEAATPQLRRRATIGGNLLQQSRCWYLRSAGFGCLHGGDGPMCQARVDENRYHAVLGALDCVRVHPSNAAPPLVVLNAEVELQGKGNQRRIPIQELWPAQPVASKADHTLTPDEVLTAVCIPNAALRGRSAYREAREKQSFDWPTASAAVWLLLEGGKISEARVCLGAVAPNPWRSEAAEAVLQGQAPGTELFTKAAEAAFADAVPLSQNAYKIQVGKAILVDALTAAAKD